MRIFNYIWNPLGLLERVALVQPFLETLVGAIGGSVVSGIFGNKQQKKQQKYDKMMSDTAYQRAMADMEAAGLNPMLAYQQGGAGGGASGIASMPAFDNPFVQHQQKELLEAQVATAKEQAGIAKNAREQSDIYTEAGKKTGAFKAQGATEGYLPAINSGLSGLEHIINMRGGGKRGTIGFPK